MENKSIDLTPHVIMVAAPGETTGLVSLYGREDVIGSKATCLKLAEELRETFPQATYTVYKLIKVKE